MRSITPADVPVAIKDESVEVRLAEVGEMTVGYFRFAKGTDLRPALAGLPGDMCQCPHWGYLALPDLECECSAVQQGSDAVVDQVAEAEGVAA